MKKNLKNSCNNLIEIIFLIIATILAFFLIITAFNEDDFDSTHLIQKTMVFTCNKPLYKSDIENLCQSNCNTNIVDEKNILKNFRNSNTKIMKYNYFEYKVNNKNSIECIVTYYDIKPGEKVPFDIDEDYKKIEIVTANISE